MWWPGFHFPYLSFRFMFDESKCELRYFEKHTDDLHNPVG